MKNVIPFFLLLVVLAACSQTARAPKNPDASLQDRYTSLEQAFRALPNVQVTGQTVTYRGTSSLGMSDEEMKVVANGRVVGTLSQAINLYPLNEIKRLKLIKPIEASQRYGNIASNGAVELVLK